MKVLSLAALLTLAPIAFALANAGPEPVLQEKKQDEKKADKPAPKPAEVVRWVKEPDTKVRFPNHVLSDVTKQKMRLAGVAVRDKRFVIMVNVYAYALYVQDDVFSKELSAYHGKPAKSLQDDQRFFDALGKDALPRTMRLHFVRDVGSKKIRDAFVDSVEPRIEHAAEKFGWKDGDKALATFRAYFGDKIRDGEVIEFMWLPGYKLTTSVAGINKGTITSKALSWALWDTYFGADPIESKGKKNVVKELAEILERTPKVKAPEKKEPEKDEKKPGDDGKQEKKGA